MSSLLDYHVLKYDKLIRKRKYQREYKRRPYAKLQQQLQGKKDWQRTKLKVFNYYSNNDIKCNCCGEKHIEFLQLDHINNDGKQHRENVKGGVAGTFYWIVRNNFPEGFQLLCFNCNLCKANDSNHICIHQREILSV